MAAIKIEKLVRKFGPVAAVDGISLEVGEGDIFGLVGPDGAGKTTILRLLTGILEPTAGQAWVNGKDVDKQAEALKADIGYMAQRFGLYEDLTVLENLHFYADLYGVGRGERPGRIKRLMEFSDLEPFGKRLAGRLSGGMKQKLGLMCCLIHTPRILFLDEPTNGVDPVSRRDFWKILYQLLKEKVTIFFSTSYLDEAERSSLVGFIHKGRLLACDKPAVIKNKYSSTDLEGAFMAAIKEYE
jgi:ABC-2 type transport system ATP-binding protein